jgi:hypothetical protein
MAVAVAGISTESIKASSTHTKGTALELWVVKLHRVGSKAQAADLCEGSATALTPVAAAPSATMAYFTGRYNK